MRQHVPRRICRIEESAEVARVEDKARTVRKHLLRHGLVDLPGTLRVAIGGETEVRGIAGHQWREEVKGTGCLCADRHSVAAKGVVGQAIERDAKGVQVLVISSFPRDRCAALRCDCDAERFTQQRIDGAAHEDCATAFEPRYHGAARQKGRHLGRPRRGYRFRKERRDRFCRVSGYESERGNTEHCRNGHKSILHVYSHNQVHSLFFCLAMRQSWSSSSGSSDAIR